MSLEGMMLAGAFGGAMGSYATGSPALGIVTGVLTALPVTALQAFLTNKLRANQIVTGLGLNILVLGGTTLAYREIFGARSREPIPGFPTWKPPLLGDIPIFGAAVFQQVWLVYAAILIVAAVALVLKFTSTGITLKAAGEDPRTLERAGVSVIGVRTAAILFTGLLAALAGTFLSIGDIHTFTEGMTNGAGYLAIAGVIFGNWKVWRTVLACFVFGSATALQFQLPAMGLDVPNALLIMMPYLLAFLAVAGVVGRQTAPRALATPYWG